MKKMEWNHPKKKKQSSKKKSDLETILREFENEINKGKTEVNTNDKRESLDIGTENNVNTNELTETKKEWLAEKEGNKKEENTNQEIPKKATSKKKKKKKKTTPKNEELNNTIKKEVTEQNEGEIQNNNVNKTEGSNSISKSSPEKQNGKNHTIDKSDTLKNLRSKLQSRKNKGAKLNEKRSDIIAIVEHEEALKQKQQEKLKQKEKQKLKLKQPK